MKVRNIIAVLAMALASLLGGTVAASAAPKAQVGLAPANFYSKEGCHVSWDGGWFTGASASCYARIAGEATQFRVHFVCNAFSVVNGPWRDIGSGKTSQATAVWCATGTTLTVEKR